MSVSTDRSIGGLFRDDGSFDGFDTCFTSTDRSIGGLFRDRTALDGVVFNITPPIARLVGYLETAKELQALSQVSTDRSIGGLFRDRLREAIFCSTADSSPPIARLVGYLETIPDAVLSSNHTSVSTDRSIGGLFRDYTKFLSNTARWDISTDRSIGGLFRDALPLNFVFFVTLSPPIARLVGYLETLLPPELEDTNGYLHRSLDWWVI